MKRVIFDTGPIVAWLCPRDTHHEWAKRAFAELRVPGIICEAVLTEACHLAAREKVPRARVIEFVIDGGLGLPPLENELPEIRRLLGKYADTPMDFADACVTRLAETHDDALVITTDSDFLIYRKSSGKPIPLIAPFVPFV